MTPSEIAAEIRVVEQRLFDLRRQLRSTRPFGVPAVSPQESGARGALAQRERYSAAQLRQWARKGGRRANRTYEEIQATPGRP